MEVREAVKSAKDWVLEVMKEEQPVNLGLEEVEFDDKSQVWKITLGFSRPWNSTKNALSTLTGDVALRRAYRTIIVDDKDGHVRGMVRRWLQLTKRQTLILDAKFDCSACGRTGGRECCACAQANTRVHCPRF